MTKMNPVVHFELPAEDTKRMADFYSKVFGWQPQFFGEEMGNYVTVSTTDTDENGRPSSPGAINGGLFPRTENMPSNCPSIVISVDDVNEHIMKVSEAGGKILGQPQDIPGIGLYVSFRDTEGNVCSILQPAMTEMENEAGHADELGQTGEI